MYLDLTHSQVAEIFILFICTLHRVSVRLGEYDIDTENDCQTIDDETVCAEPVQDIPVETVNFHHNYNNPKWSNDIALIRLSRAANTKPGII